MRVRFTRRAQANLDAIFRYLAAENPGAASELVHAITALIARLSEFSELGHPTQPPGRRVLTVPRAPYRVFYRIVGSEIRILSIRHTSRRPPHVET